MSLDLKKPKNYRKAPLRNDVPSTPVEALELLINYVEACSYVAMIPESNCETMRQVRETLNNAQAEDPLGRLAFWQEKCRQALRQGKLWQHERDVLWHFSTCPYDHCPRCIDDEVMIKAIRDEMNTPAAAEVVYPLCKKSDLCARANGHPGDCDDIPF